jgi:hypothetical protein
MPKGGNIQTNRPRLVTKDRGHAGVTTVDRGVVMIFTPAGTHQTMEVLLWIVVLLGLVMLMCGVALTIRRQMLWGISLVLAGMLTGSLAATVLA